MKKILSLVLTLGAAVMVHAQGTFLPATYASDPNFTHAGGSITDATAGNAFAFGSGYQAQYYIGPANTTDATTLTAVGPQAALLGASTSDPAAGYFEGNNNGTITTTFAGGSTVTLQLRAWKGNSSSTYAAAGVKGASQLLQIVLGNPNGSPPTSPTSITTMSNFAVVGPEPATIALGLMGAGALFIRRRKV
jgi:hypothetical protein